MKLFIKKNMVEDIRKNIEKTKKILYSLNDVVFINESSLNSILNKHYNDGFIIISNYRYDNNNHENKTGFEKLKSDVKKSKYSFIPVYGGFIENLGMENEIEVKEPSLLIPNYEIGSNKRFNSDEKLKELGIKLTNEYNQDSFLYKPQDKGNIAYYIDKNGNIDTEFKNKSINYLTKIYFTDLVKKSYNKGKKSGFGKITKRFTFTNEIFINKSPIDLNEAKKRYGELFFNF